MGPPQADWDETVIPVGRGAEGFDVSPNGKEIWAANAQDGTISIVDLRLLGVASLDISARRLMRDVIPYTWGAFAIAA